MRKQLVNYLVIFVGIYVAAIVIALWSSPALFSNILGFLALFSYFLTVIPGILKVVFPGLSRQKIFLLLLKHRRYLGVLTFCLALNHGCLQILKRHLNLLSPYTYLHYFQGFSMMLILTLLAFTSSNESVKGLKKNWQKLHRLTYLIILLLPWHILDKMDRHWTYITPVAVLLSAIFVGLFLARLYQQKLQSAY